MYNVFYDDVMSDLLYVYSNSRTRLSQYFYILYITRCTRGVRVFFSIRRIRSSNSARINTSNFNNEKII